MCHGNFVFARFEKQFHVYTKHTYLKVPVSIARD